MIIKNAKSKNHIRTNHTVRSICITLLTVLIFSASSIYAASEVTIVAGTGSGISQFADYNSNTTVANSYIVVDSNVPFSNAFNALSRNIAKLTSTAASSNLYINTTNSYIATLYTYLSNNLPGQWQTLTDIKTATTNAAVSSQAMLTLLGDQVNIDWVNTNVTSVQSVSRSFDQSNPISPSYSSIGHGSFYFLLSDLGSIARNLNSVTYRVDLPLAFSNFRNDSYGFEIAIFNSYGDDVTDKFDIVDYFLLNNDYTLSVYMVGVPFPQGYPFTIRVTTENNIIYNPTTRYIYYLKDGTIDAMNFSNFLHLSNLSTDDIVNKLDNLQVNSSFDDTDIIDAINNLSLQDNDVKLNLTINNNTGSDGTNIITRLQNFFNTGISVSDFFDNVDDAESGWFTQSNSDVINTLRGGYTNFYE